MGRSKNRKKRRLGSLVRQFEHNARQYEFMPTRLSARGRYSPCRRSELVFMIAVRDKLRELKKETEVKRKQDPNFKTDIKTNRKSLYKKYLKARYGWWENFKMFDPIHQCYPMSELQNKRFQKRLRNYKKWVEDKRNQLLAYGDYWRLMVSKVYRCPTQNYTEFCDTKIREIEVYNRRKMMGLL